MDTRLQDRAAFRGALFCFLLLLGGCAPAHKPPFYADAPSELVFNVDYHIQYGERLHMVLHHVDGDARDMIMDADIAGGTYQAGVMPGVYEFTVTGTRAPGATTVTFTVGPNEYWVWQLSDPARLPSFNYYPVSPVKIENKGPLRADPVVTAVAGRDPLQPDGFRKPGLPVHQLPAADDR